MEKKKKMKWEKYGERIKKEKYEEEAVLSMWNNQNMQSSYLYILIMTSTVKSYLQSPKEQRTKNKEANIKMKDKPYKISN